MSTLFINFCIHFHTKTFHPNPSLVLWEWVQNENEFYNKNYINLLSGQVSPLFSTETSEKTFWKLSSWWSGRDESWNHLHLAQLKILFAVFMHNFFCCVSLYSFLAAQWKSYKWQFSLWQNKSQRTPPQEKYSSSNCKLQLKHENCFIQWVEHTADWN